RPCTRRAAFFFQADDGIRGFHVTGVQTCALPISPAAGPPCAARAARRARRSGRPARSCATGRTARPAPVRHLRAASPAPAGARRSEERRVGNEATRSATTEQRRKGSAAGEGAREG